LLCLHGLNQWALYLPMAWTEEPERMAKAHIPQGTGIATKPAIAAEVPFNWVAAESVYGVGAIETALRHAGKGYVPGVKVNHLFHS
jgi:SRSO17 transposase